MPPSTQQLRASPHFQTLIAHAPKLAISYLAGVDPDFAKAKPAEKRAYLSHVTAEPLPELKPFGGAKEGAQEEPKPAVEFSPLTLRLLKALGVGYVGREALEKLNLPDIETQKLLVRLSGKELKELSAGKVEPPYVRPHIGRAEVEAYVPTKRRVWR